MNNLLGRKIRVVSEKLLTFRIYYDIFVEIFHPACSGQMLNLKMKFFIQYLDIFQILIISIKLLLCSVQITSTQSGPLKFWDRKCYIFMLCYACYFNFSLVMIKNDNGVTSSCGFWSTFPFLKIPLPTLHKI